MMNLRTHSTPAPNTPPQSTGSVGAANSEPPRTLVLLATYNGARWLDEQLQSILSQRGVQPHILVSDDHSSDDTLAIVARYAQAHPVELLPTTAERFGNANRNFIRLIADADASAFDFVAFCDQDDIWLPDKLLTAATRLGQTRADVYSSDVVAFWPDGREKHLVKSQRQRLYDHLFESAGPGCTFVLARQRFLELQSWVRQHRGATKPLRAHDWLIYAFARSRGWQWVIDSHIGLRYRQHGGNEVGANIGLKSALVRLRKARTGVYVHDVLEIADSLRLEGPMLDCMRRLGWLDRLRLVLNVRHFRRRFAEQWVLAALFLIMQRPDREALRRSACR